MNGVELTGLVCILGVSGALAFKQFDDTLKGLPQTDREYLLRAHAALEVIPKDAGAEYDTLRHALCRLRDELAGTVTKKK